MKGKVKRPRHPQPMQPIVRAVDGVIRFQPNAIIAHIVDLLTGECPGAILSYGETIDYNALMAMPWSDADRDQFNQLHGYSVSGLPFRSRALKRRAYAIADGMAKRSKRARRAR